MTSLEDDDYYPVWIVDDDPNRTKRVWMRKPWKRSLFEKYLDPLAIFLIAAFIYSYYEFIYEYAGKPDFQLNEWNGVVLMLPIGVSVKYAIPVYLDVFHHCVLRSQSYIEITP